MISALVLTLLASGQPKPPEPSVTIHDQAKGTGVSIKDGDVVAIDYTGTLENGTVFDSTKGQTPFMFMVGANQVITGWEIGVKGMREGGKRDLVIPPALGYGNRAVAGIPANSTLHFSITLIKIEPKVQIQIMTPGLGNEAKVGDIVEINLTGGVQGKKAIFDSRDADHGKPIQLLIGDRTLPIGYVPALVGMKEGEKRRVVIPPELAYGKAGSPATDHGDVKAGSMIPPNSTMVFDFELVKIDPRQH